jgi:hypothetical protein
MGFAFLDGWPETDQPANKTHLSASTDLSDGLLGNNLLGRKTEYPKTELLSVEPWNFGASVPKDKGYPLGHMVTLK